MHQSAALVQALKRALKARGVTYAWVGRALNLSEASVKRLFAEGNFTLQRLEAILDLLGMDFRDLIDAVEDQDARLDRLSGEQEQAIVDDIWLLLILICLLNHWSVAQITERYRLSETECIVKLARLDRLKLIDLLPGNRVKLKLSPTFRWIEDGPIQHFFQQRVKEAFFASRFDAEGERLLCVNGMMTQASNRWLQSRMERLAREFGDMVAGDGLAARREPGVTPRWGTTLVLALRPWEFAAFEALKR
ncbi:MAG: helix-turn-helix domain-containing protein [Candidatus Competibacterales bacterium]